MRRVTVVKTSAEDIESSRRGGVATLALGGLMLVDSPIGFVRVSPGVVVPAAPATAAITVFLLSQVVRAQRQPPATGAEALLHERAVADEPFKSQDGLYVGRTRTTRRLKAVRFRVRDQRALSDDAAEYPWAG